MNLYILLIIPSLTLACIIAFKETWAKWVALMGSFLQLSSVIYLTIQYMAMRASGNVDAMLFTSAHAWFPAWNINFHVGIDGIALSMILLTAVVLPAGILVSWKISDRAKEFFFLLVFLATGAFGFFISLDLFTLFFFFELAVIPKFLLIARWGSGNKSYNAMKLALMLMGGSALVLIGILGTFYYSSQIGSTGFDLNALNTHIFPKEAQHFLFSMLFIGFAVLNAMFPFHTWAPDGHSTAPTAASMFLAGISMKLGGYGCLRVATVMFPETALEYSPFIIVLSCIGILYGAFVTLRQTDIKMMNAYSSVSHCGFITLGIGMMTKAAIAGAVLQMVSHGIMTALFFAVIGMVYERTHTREGSKWGGLMKKMPFISAIFILAGLTSLGLPGLSGFVAEMSIFTGSFQHTESFYRIATIIATASIVVTAVYILRAVGTGLWGPMHNPEYENLSDATWAERSASIILLSSIIIMGILPMFLSGIIQFSTESLFGNLIP